MKKAEYEYTQYRSASLKKMRREVYKGEGILKLDRADKVNADR